ncbi:MAG: DUF1579 family protein, partial [Planctomycetota bacterium]
PMEPPKPAKELEKFSRLIGYWQGEGTSTSDPSKPMSKWTSFSHCRKVMDGHFLREDLRIESDAWTTPMQFINFYGYNQQKKRFIVAGISNMGTAELAEINFHDDNTMITASTKLYQGKRIVERWVTKLGDGEMSFVGHEAIGDSDFFVHVKGTAKKVDAKPKAKIIEAAFSFMGEPSAEMGKMKGLVGTMTFKGEMLMMPGTPMVPITGESTTEPLFAGTVLQTVINGDPIDGQAYHGWHALAWDPVEKSYVSLGLNNMGEAMTERGVWVSKTELLFTAALPWYGGIPSVYSGVMKCADDGTLKSYTAHAIIGTHKPVKSFHIDYSKK